MIGRRQRREREPSDASEHLAFSFPSLNQFENCKKFLLSHTQHLPVVQVGTPLCWPSLVSSLLHRPVASGRIARSGSPEPRKSNDEVFWTGLWVLFP